jgi:DNA-binding NarL/FixJ family response regulator
MAHLSANKIVIADENKKYGKAMAEFLESNGYDVLGIASNERDLFTMLKQRKPNILIYDFFISQDVYRFASTMEKIKGLLPNVKTLISSVDDYLELKKVSRESGAKGFWVKTMKVESLLDMVKKVKGNTAVFSKQLA